MTNRQLKNLLLALAPTLLDLVMPDGAPRHDASDDPDDIDGTLDADADIFGAAMRGAQDATRWSGLYEALRAMAERSMAPPPMRPAERTRVLVQEVALPAGGTVEARFVVGVGMPHRLVVQPPVGGGVADVDGVDVTDVVVNGRRQFDGPPMPAAVFSQAGPELKMDAGRLLLVKLRSRRETDVLVNVLVHVRERVMVPSHAAPFVHGIVKRPDPNIRALDDVMDDISDLRRRCVLQTEGPPSMLDIDGKLAEVIKELEVIQDRLAEA
jgi:hypothetical protein